MNVYDFDGTIYKGDSSVDFAKYCIKKNKKCWRAVPRTVGAGIRYALKQISTKDFKEVFFSFLRQLEPKEIDGLVAEFWKTHKDRIASWYKENQNDDDVVISASPRFLLEPIMMVLGIKNLIATEMNKSSSVISGENCKGVEKVRRLKNEYPGVHIDHFYSDSLSDYPLAEIADEAFLVNGEQINPWPEKGEKV